MRHRPPCAQLHGLTWGLTAINPRCVGSPAGNVLKTGPQTVKLHRENQTFTVDQVLSQSDSQEAVFAGRATKHLCLQASNKRCTIDAAYEAVP